jgi:uncharacterized protein GlcG (DUF336 family)
MDEMTLVAATQIAQKALEAGRQRELAPLAVAVLDARACVRALLSEDGCSTLRAEIAQAKASSALALGAGGAALARRAEQNPAFFNSLGPLSNGQMVPVRGSVLVRSATGRVLGAVGISGDTPGNDEICAVTAIEDAGLHADTGEQR